MDNNGRQIIKPGPVESSYALASIIFGVVGTVWFYFDVKEPNMALILETIGFVTGIIALVQIRYSARQITGEKLAIRGIWISVYSSILPIAVLFINK